MRILYLSGSTIPSRTANSVQVMKMCQAFVCNGHEVSLMARQGPALAGSDADFYGVNSTFTVTKLGSEGALGRTLFPVRVISSATMERIPDLVYARHLPSLVLMATKRSVPFIFEAHMAPDSLQRLMFSRLFRHPSFARLVVISRALEAEFGRVFPGLPTAKIQVSPDGADLPAEELQVLRDLDPSEVLNVGYVGHLYKGKGVHRVVELARRIGDVRFHVVGGEPEAVERWRGATAEIDNIAFHGHVPHPEAISWMQTMDVLVAPYQPRVAHAGGNSDIGQWMSPLKLFEYMAVRRPIVASNLPVVREILDSEEDALLVDPLDTDAWVSAIERLRNPSVRLRLAGRAFEKFESKYTWQRRAQGVLEGVT